MGCPTHTIKIQNPVRIAIRSSLQNSSRAGEGAYVAGHRDNLRILIGDTGHRAVTSIGDPVVDAIVYFVNWERIRVVRALDRKGSSGKARLEFKLQASSLDA